MGLKLTPPPNQMSAFESPAWQGWFYLVFNLFGVGNLGSLTVAALPPTAQAGQLAYASNGRKVGEGVGAGTGVPVYFSLNAWRVYSTDAVVAA